MTTVAEVYTNCADKSEPTLYQGSAVVAEEAGTDGTTNVRDRSIDWNTMETTVMKLATDRVTRKEPTLTQVSPVVAKMAHKDGTRVMQYQLDDQKIMKTTNMQMPMDFLEIPETDPAGGFLELAEEARNVKIESGTIMLYGGSSIAGNRVDKTGFCYCYGIQFTCTRERGYQSRRCLFRDDTNQKFCWTT